MVKTPIKVLIRARPTANYAHQNVQIDENTGYIQSYAAISTLTFLSLPTKAWSTISKRTGAFSSRRFSLMHPRRLSLTSLPRISCSRRLRATPDALCVTVRRELARPSRWLVRDLTTSIEVLCHAWFPHFSRRSVHAMNITSKSQCPI